MKNFISFKQFLKESILDPKKKTLDPLVFEDVSEKNPKIKKAIINQILINAQQFTEFGKIQKMFILGSILTKHYTPVSDIDVTILMSDDADLSQRFSDVIEMLNGKIAPGTGHPINYYVTFAKDFNEDRADNIYDIFTDTWIKVTEDYDVDAEQYMEDFIEKVSKLDINTAQIRRDLIDIKKIRNMTDVDKRYAKRTLLAKMRNITDAIKSMTEIKKELKKLRSDAFTKPLSPKELQKIKSRNALPENVIYKLAEYYWYWEFIEELKKAMGSDKKVSSEKNVSDIKKAVKKFAGKVD